MLIIRHSKPSKHDVCCYGSVCKSLKVHSDEFDIYVQMSENQDNPNWEKAGTFTPKTEELVTQEINRMLNIKKSI
jgi:hypothetical protein